ncbi:uncharacterized protein LODBEIA_P58070 [Lodderomyces beijingensis]|uniref:Uncharacterized protein n=1 Tax=Lodderomyces beijingensis TaxID=1775926 RepID=A0ABP0ZV49_9ASCO
MFRQNVPRPVRRLVELYRAVSEEQNTLYPKAVKDYFGDAAMLRQRDDRWDILCKNMMRGRNVPRHEYDLFCEPIDFGPNELLATKHLFIDRKGLSNMNDVLPQLPGREQVESIYVRDLVSTINSSFKKLLMLPAGKKEQNTVKTYINMFYGTAPVMIFLRQRNLLFSRQSIDHWNQPVFDIQRRVGEINQAFTKKQKQQQREQGECKKVVQYKPVGFSKITRPDLLVLSLAIQRYYKYKPRSWAQLFNDFKLAADDQEDELAAYLRNLLPVRISSSGECNEDELDSLVEEALDEVGMTADPYDAIADFPYNLEYCNLYMFNITNMDADLDTVVKCLQKSKLEIIGARFCLSNPQVRSSLSKLAQHHGGHGELTYENILQLAKSRSQEGDEGDGDGNGKLGLLLKHLASANMTFPLVNEQGNGLYLMDPSNL